MNAIGISLIDSCALKQLWSSLRQMEHQFVIVGSPAEAKMIPPVLEVRNENFTTCLQRNIGK